MIVDKKYDIPEIKKKLVNIPPGSIFAKHVARVRMSKNPI